MFADGKAQRFERIANPYSIFRRIANHAETQKQTKHRSKRNIEANETQLTLFRRICNPPVLIIRICNPIDNSLFADGKAWRFERIANPYSIVRRIANHAETQDLFRRICNPPVLIIRICNPIDNSLFADGKAWRFERITNPYSIVRRIANHAETQRKKQTKHRNRRNAEATEAAEIRYFYSEMKQNYNRIYYNQLKNINFALNADRNNMSNTRASFTLHELHFITITVVDWIDIFTRPLYKHIITDSLAYCQQNKGLRIFAWVLMSNHLHAIVDASGELSVADIVRDFKKYTSKRLLKEIQTNPNESRREWILNRLRYAGNNDKKITNYRLWQDGYHPEQIYTYEFYKQKLDYIHLNPVRQELVAKAEDYLYSSATDYAGGKGLVDVLVI